MTTTLRSLSLVGLVIVAIAIFSFQSSTEQTRLGKTRYYIEKPNDCTLKVMMDQDQEKSWSVFGTDEADGKCTITIDKKYHERKSKVKVSTYFNEDILGHNISISEYPYGKFLYRTAEVEDNGSFLYFECTGKDKTSLEKFFAILKSLSYKAK